MDQEIIVTSKTWRDLMKTKSLKLVKNSISPRQKVAQIKFKTKQSIRNEQFKLLPKNVQAKFAIKYAIKLLNSLPNKRHRN